MSGNTLTRNTGVAADEDGDIVFSNNDNGRISSGSSSSSDGLRKGGKSGVEVRHLDDADDNSNEEAQLLHSDSEDDGLELDELTSPDSDVENRPFRKSKSRQQGRKRHRYCDWLWGGPAPSKTQRIEPRAWLLPRLQAGLVDVLDCLFPQKWQKGMLLVGFGIVWMLTVVVPVVLTKGKVVADGQEVKHLGCVTSLWGGDAECGLGGRLCEPFGNTSVAFRCPADCAGVKLLNPRWVGNQQINYRAYVIGGGEGVYRGDSFVCQAGVHAGVVTDKKGGCGRVKLKGEYYRFENSTQNGVESVQFGSYFPMSYEVEKVEGCGRGDARWGQLIVSIGLSLLLGAGTRSGKVMFFGGFTGVFLHVGLVSDPPDIEVMSGRLVQELVGIMVGRLLPAVFIMVVVYWAIGRRTLEGVDEGANWEKTLLWMGGLWLGGLTNNTFEAWIPISRLEGHDLRQQPGAVVALVVVVGLLIALGTLQAWHFWQEGRLPKFLAFYAGAIAVIATLVVMPGLELRLHHYVLALLLLPGTAMQTRPSLLFQGLLVGLFINGVARWGFDSVLQTYDSIRGDGQYGSLVPEVVAPFIETLEMGVKQETIHFKWSALDDVARLREKIEGISVLVNDVERFRGWFTETKLEDMVFSWPRFRKADEYFRFSFVGEGGNTLDWTEAGTWFANGTWSKGVGFYKV